MIETPSDLLWSSSAKFNNLRKMFENVRLTFGTILENLRKSSESDLPFSCGKNYISLVRFFQS